MTHRKGRKLSGRAVPDEKGNQTWVWHSDDSVDTAVVRALGEGLTLEGLTALNQTGANPYDRMPPRATEKAASRRRTLDDMRKLSEAIKRSKRTITD